MDTERAARIQALLQHPSWPDLEAEVREQEEKYAAAVTKILFHTGEIPSLFEYKRGFFAGMRAIIAQPGEAVKALEKEAKRNQKEEVEPVDQWS